MEESPSKESKYGLYHGVWKADGAELGVYGGMGFGFRPPERGISARTDRMWDAGYYDGGPTSSTRTSGSETRTWTASRPSSSTA